MRRNGVLAVMVYGMCIILLAAAAQGTQLSSPLAVSGERLLAIVNVNLVPMTSPKTIPGQAVLVAGNTIHYVGSQQDLAIPADALIIDGNGGFLMPGLADMHMHLTLEWQRGDWISGWGVSPLSLYLANGVTTVRCLGPKGQNVDYVQRWQKYIRQERMHGPQIYSCGPILYGPVEDPANTVMWQHRQGFEGIKLYSFLSPTEFNNAISKAQQLGMYTVGHIPFQVGLDGIIAAQLDEIAHIEEFIWETVPFDRHVQLKGYAWLGYVVEAAHQHFETFTALNDNQLKRRFTCQQTAMAQKIKAAGTTVCTTLYLDDVIVEKLHSPEAFLTKPVNLYLSQSYAQRLRSGQEKHQLQFKGNAAAGELKRKFDRSMLAHLKQAGVFMVLGTDAGGGWMGLVPGFSVHTELRALVENGFTPYEALKLGTVNASKVVARMTGEDAFGTIEVGKRADLILLKDDPLIDIDHTRSIVGVMAAGRWYPKAKLQQMIQLPQK